MHHPRHPLLSGSAGSGGKHRGIKLVLLKNHPSHPDVPATLAGEWKMDELVAKINPRTRLIAISHVQFTSGYAADLQLLGDICKEKNIDLVVDVAQSMGALPVHPEEWNISALATSGWKWLLGPFGTGLFYTSPEFRNKLQITQIGAETMVQGFDFLNHTWSPHLSAKRFEYSSSPFQLAGALLQCLEKVHNFYGIEAIREEIFRLQDVFLTGLQNNRFTPLSYKGIHRSGILSLYHPNASEISKKLLTQSIVCTVRGGYLRVAPHYYNSDDEMTILADSLNTY